MQTDGEEEPEALPGAEEQEQAGAQTGDASSTSQSANKTKKNTSLNKLQHKGDWKMYDNPTAGRRDDNGRLQRDQDRPDYDDAKPRVFGHDPDHSKKEGKKKKKWERKLKKAGKAAFTSSVKKPRGRPPKNKVWDEEAGAYVSDEDAPAAKKAKPSDPATKEALTAKKTKAELASEIDNLRAQVIELRGKVFGS